MRKNLYIINEISPAGNYGVGTYVSQMSEMFSGGEGVSAYVIQLCSDKEEFVYDESTNTFHIPMGKRYSTNKRLQYIKGVSKIFRLHLPIQEHDIFIFNFFTHFELIDFTKEQFPGCKIIFTIHYLDWSFLAKGNTSLFKSIIDNPKEEGDTLANKMFESFSREKKVLERVDKIVCLSKYTLDLLIRNYGICSDKITIIYNGLRDEAKPPPPQINGKTDLCISDLDKIILYVGRLDKDKGASELIKAFRIVSKTYPNHKLIIIGDGNFKIYQEVSDNLWTKIIYTGKLKKEQVYKFYQVADVGVLPSFTEQCSYVAIEMMMFGLPIVGTNSTGLSEMIEDGITGYKVQLKETEDDVLLPEEDLAEKIISLSEDPDIQRIKDNSRRRFMEKYTLEGMKKKFQRLILDTSAKLILLIIFLCCGLSPAIAQTVITGKITDAKRESVPDVTVMLLQVSDSTIASFAMSDAKGNYKLVYDGDESHFLISISAFDIKQQTKKIENHTQTVNFTAEKGSIAIKEVVVKGAKAWGTKDTINYSVDAFKDETDVVIGDVLKKLPGIKVSESGGISYKGKPINKFYIENLDLLQGRYGIATNNVPAADIKTVQVLENHQPVKALEKTRYSDQAAINLKIKDEKKGIFSIMAVLGLGIDKDAKALWQEELTGMYFGRQRQQLYTYKTNNSGYDVSKELRKFTTSKAIGGLQMVNVKQPSPPAIKFERYNFNNTHAATVNNLFKLNNDAQVNANIIYYHNKDRRHSFARTSYLLPGDSTQVISEDILARSTTNTIEGEFRYNLNKDRKYFNNFLHILGGWDDGAGEVNTGEFIGQALDNRNMSIDNTLHWINRGEKERGVEILSTNAFRTEPSSLTINPGLYPDRLNGGEDYAKLTQNVYRNAFASNNKFSFLSAIMIGDVRFNPTANFNIKHQTLKSDLDVTDQNGISHTVSDIEMRNDIVWTRMDAVVSLNTSYKGQSFQFNIFMPLSYRYTIIDDVLLDEDKQSVGKYYFQPSLSAKYDITNQLEINARAGYYSQIPELPRLYTGYILQNYRSINRYDARIFDTDNLNASLNLAYKNILSLFFAGGGMSYSQYHSEGMYGQVFDSTLSITRLTMQPNSGNSFSVNGRASKGFDWKSLKLSAEASWGKSESEQMRQNNLIAYKSQWTRANGAVNMKLAKWLIAEYKLSWGYSKGETDAGDKFPGIRSLTNRVFVSISLPHNISLNGTYEHYYNSALQTSKNFSLADAGLTYTYKKIKFSLDWTNILNTEKYVSAYYGALNTYYSEYDIRPMAIMLKVRFKLL